MFKQNKSGFSLAKLFKLRFYNIQKAKTHLNYVYQAKLSPKFCRFSAITRPENPGPNYNSTLLFRLLRNLCY